MAKRRMFSQQITESDPFLEMPLSAQALYFHLGMVADDDGFVNNPKRTQRVVGANEDDLKLLIAKNFIIAEIQISQTLIGLCVMLMYMEIYMYIKMQQ